MNSKKTIVIGIGGMGGNCINAIITSNLLDDVDFAVANTDAAALDHSLAMHTIQLGANLTRGLGAAANPEIGRASALESLSDMTGYLEPYYTVIFIAGLGGGTGSGAVAVIAKHALDLGKTVICIVTMPFQFEGSARAIKAQEALMELDTISVQKHVFNNQDLFKTVDDKSTFADAFRVADEVILKWIGGVLNDTRDEERELI